MWSKVSVCKVWATLLHKSDFSNKELCDLSSQSTISAFSKIWHFLTFKVKSFQMKTRKCTSRDPQCTMLDIQAYGQQVSPDRHSIWIPNMLQSGSPDSSGDNECQACVPPLHAL